jgi:hypothetical protein
MAACRSQRRPVWRQRWRHANRLLLVAAVSSLAVLGLSLLLPGLASLLGQAPPPAAGWAVVALAVPAVWRADATHKAVRRRRSAAGGR